MKTGKQRKKLRITTRRIVSAVTHRATMAQFSGYGPTARAARDDLLGHVIASLPGKEWTVAHKKERRLQGGGAPDPWQAGIIVGLEREIAELKELVRRFMGPKRSGSWLSPKQKECLAAAAVGRLRRPTCRYEDRIDVRRLADLEYVELEEPSDCRDQGRYTITAAGRAALEASK